MRRLKDGALGIGQLDAVLRAIEEADAELALEPCDLLAQRRLSDVQPLSRAPEVELLCEHHERASSRGSSVMHGAYCPAETQWTSEA